MALIFIQLVLGSLVILGVYIMYKFISWILNITGIIEEPITQAEVETDLRMARLDVKRGIMTQSEFDELELTYKVEFPNISNY